MPAEVFPEWPDYAALSKHGDHASLTDDLGRGQLTLSVRHPYWTERWLSAADNHTQQNAGVRFLCPLAGGGQSPFTLLAVYNLQAALLQDAEPLKTKLTSPVNGRDKAGADAQRIADSGQGGLIVQRLTRDWLALTVNDENVERQKKPSSVTLFFNRHRRPNTYAALMAVAQGMRRDNHHYPLKQR